ncbi:Protein arv1 [Astathelohania contejeani]|uniref:Protein ARV n=1 Tax=Astathelohania contejeani TaxID=164912 RepID=A0ABQ7HYU0_9MICR|nr:Protein arv1 [Thelohania contejeani]
MLCCIECGKETKSLTTKYSNYIQVSKCKYCKKKVDKYLEFNNTVLLIDLILLKKNAFRHIIYNSTYRTKKTLYFYIFFTTIKILFNLKKRIGKLIPFNCDMNNTLFTGYNKTLINKHWFICNYKSILKSIFDIIIESLLYKGFTILFLIATLYVQNNIKKDIFRRLINTIVFSSFYHIFLLFTLVWNYSYDEYYFIVEFLVFIANSTALSILAGKKIYYFYFALFLFKTLSKTITRIIIQ